MRSLDVSRTARIRWPSHHVIADFSESHATGPLTLFLFHMITVSRLCLPFVLAGLLVSPVSVTPICYPDFLSRRFSLRPVLYPVRFPSYHSPDWTLFLSLTFTDSTPVCTCIVRTCIYTGLEMGRSPSSIYFATTLVL